MIVGLLYRQVRRAHGFLRTPDGKIISFDAPGLGYGLDQGTVALSINDLGVIAGQYQDSNYVCHGFVRYPNGSFTKFDVPGAGTGAFQGTCVWDLNWKEKPRGFTRDGQQCGRTALCGHLTAGSPSFDPPGSVGTYSARKQRFKQLRAQSRILRRCG